MITIEQGSNASLQLFFGENYSDCTFSALLYNYKGSLKHWTTSDVTFDNNTVILPLTEAETLGFNSGRAKLSVKFLNTRGEIVFTEDEDVKIIYKQDKTRLIAEDE